MSPSPLPSVIISPASKMPLALTSTTISPSAPTGAFKPVPSVTSQVAPGVTPKMSTSSLKLPKVVTTPSNNSVGRLQVQGSKILGAVEISTHASAAKAAWSLVTLGGVLQTMSATQPGLVTEASESKKNVKHPESFVAVIIPGELVPVNEPAAKPPLPAPAPLSIKAAGSTASAS